MILSYIKDLFKQSVMADERKLNTYGIYKQSGDIFTNVKGHSIETDSDTGQILIYKDDDDQEDEVVVAVIPKDFVVIISE